MKKHERIISLAKKRNARHLKRNKTFGIRMSKYITEAYEIDRENGNNYWQVAIAKEMKNVYFAFNVLDDGKVVSKDHQYVCCHMILM